MKMAGEQQLAAPPDKVWAAMNDPDVLMRAIPGCKELVKLSDTEFAAKVMVKVGPIKATFKGAVSLTDIEVPESYTIVGEGKGGIAGFAKGSAAINLEPDGPDGTILRYDVETRIGGKIAQLGARMIESTARRLTASFFDEFNDIVAGGSGEADAAQLQTTAAG